MGTKYERNLPNNAYEAAVNADNPSANNPYATVNELPAPSSGNQLISGGASYSGTGMVFNVSVLVYTITGIEYTTAATDVTLLVGDPSNPRFDAIVASIDANDNPIVEVLQGTPATTPSTPTLEPDQVLVQYVLVGTNATTPNITTEYIYRNDQTSDWQGSTSGTYTACTPNLDNTANFASPTPSPVAGAAVCLSVAGRGGVSNARGTRFGAGVPVSREDYAVLSFYINFPSPGWTQQGKGALYVVLWGNNTYNTNTGNYLGYILAGNYCDTSLVDTWQLVNIPTAEFDQNPNVTTIGGFSISGYPNICTPVEFALDEVKLQTGFGPSTNIATIDILENDTLVAPTAKLNFKDGTNTTVAVTENALNNTVEVEVSSTGGSSIYTADGTIPLNRLVQIQNGLIWSGSTMLRTTNSRNIKEVIQESDLGTTLAANTTYVIRGKVTVTNSIAVTNVGVEVVGLNRETDEIEWAGTGNLFFVRDTNFTMANLKLSSSAAGNNILSGLNVQGSGYNNERNKVLTLTNCQFRGTYDVMDIDGFDLVDISQCLFFYVKATNWGLRFRDTSKLQITSSEFIRWFDETALPAPVPADFATVSMIEFRANGVGPGFGAVNINGCIIHPQETQNGIDIATGSTTAFGTISSNAFVNAGLTTGKVFLPEVSGLPDYSSTETLGYDVFANQGVLNSTSGIIWTMLGNNGQTNTTPAGTAVIMAVNGASAVKAVQGSVRYDLNLATGRATYTGKKQVYVSIHASLTYVKQGGGGADLYTFEFYKNGTLLPGSGTSADAPTADPQSLTMTYGVLMEQNDYIEIYITNDTATDPMLVRDLQFLIRE
jgi:hypothetical protein